MQRGVYGRGQEEGDFEVSRLDGSQVRVDSEVRPLKQLITGGRSRRKIWKDDVEFT